MQHHLFEVKLVIGNVMSQTQAMTQLDKLRPQEEICTLLCIIDVNTRTTDVALLVKLEVKPVGMV